MANLKEISRKIKSVKSTQKTTKAMKLVSSAKLRRTQQLQEKAKSYALKINEVLSEIAHRVRNVHDDVSELSRVFQKQENIKVVDIVFVTADKGLCGGFNVATIKKVKALYEKYSSKGIKVRLRAVGRKGIDYFNFQGYELLDAEIGVSSSPSYKNGADFMERVFTDYMEAKSDKVILVYNGFINMLTQELKVKELLPITDIDLDKVEINSSALEIEPADDEEVILDELSLKYVEFNMYYALIDSLAAEHSARMQAMDAATNNAKERVEQLTLDFNKARQAAITTELIEIISGVESLK
jgi:F-type H+-transporting ATPase subunit gamma